MRNSPLRSHDLKYSAQVALLSLLLNTGLGFLGFLLLLFLPVLEGSFPDGGQQAARSSYDWS